MAAGALVEDLAVERMGSHGDAPSVAGAAPQRAAPAVQAQDAPRAAGSEGMLMQELVTSGLSVGCATAVTNPLDVVKTRMQLRQAQSAPSPGLVKTGVDIVRIEGVGALWKGLPPAVLRGLLYGGLRLGLYSPTRDWLQRDAADAAGAAGAGIASKPAPASAGTKLLAGTLSGGVAAALSSPTELVKVRLQAADNVHKSAWDAARAVMEADGVRGLWKGATPGLVRASVLTASQCATYDEAKRRIMDATGWGDTVATHLTCALATGFAATLATNPIDVVKTHMFVAGGRFAGPVACARELYARHGAGGFMRGFAANYSRLGPQTVVTFMVAEQLRRIAGLQSL